MTRQEQIEKPKCKTCGDTRQKFLPPSPNRRLGKYIPCPDCQPKAESEFTKQLAEANKRIEALEAIACSCLDDCCPNGYDLEVLIKEEILKAKKGE